MIRQLDLGLSFAETCFTFEGRPMRAPAGSSVAAALLHNGVDRFQRAPLSGSPRLPYCMMGACFECVVVADGSTVQACLIAVTTGMAIAREGHTP